MADLKNIEDIKSLVDDVDSFFENPNFTPKKQNKFFFSEGTSYYKQLLEVSKVIKMLQTSIKAIYDNQNTLQEEYDALDVEGLLALKDRVTSLETKATDLISKVSSLESDNVSNKAQIETNKTDIATLDSEIDTAQADIENIKSDVKTNYLKDISITSTDIKTTEVSRVDGVKSIQMEVTSTTPVDLGSQLTYIKQQNANVVNEVGTTTIEDNETDNSYDVKQENKVIENGNITTTSNTISKFDKDNFTNVEGIISTKLDYEETKNKLTEQENNLKGIQEQVNTNTSDIATNKTSIEGIKSEVEQTIQTELTSVKADVATNKTNIESNTANIRDLITKDSELSSKIDTNTTNISTNASAIETNKTAIANNTGLITNTSDNLTSLTNRFNGILLSTGYDLNNLVEVGMYYCTNNSALVNAPTNEENNWATIQVMPTADNTYVQQIWYSTDRATHTKVENYQRIIKVDKSEQWEWIKYVSEQDINELKGYWATITTESDTTEISVDYTDFEGLTYSAENDYILDVFVFGSDTLINISSMAYSETAITITFDVTITSTMKVMFNLKEI